MGTRAKSRRRPSRPLLLHSGGGSVRGSVSRETTPWLLGVAVEKNCFFFQLLSALRLVSPKQFAFQGIWVLTTSGCNWLLSPNFLFFL
jgi:hypothetical protein